MERIDEGFDDVCVVFHSYQIFTTFHNFRKTSKGF